MRLNTPSFWYDTDAPTSSAKAAALSSLSAIYGLGHALHQMAAHPKKANIPVICIGNLVAGGSGKTPAAIAVMDIIREQKLFSNPCFLSRGYGGTLSDPVSVDPAQHTAEQVGDEPLLLVASAPTIISANRFDGAAFAQSLGHDAIIMDDGLQNSSLKPDFSIVVIDGASGFGNGLLLPAGPLRTPLHRGLALADAVLIIGQDTRDSIAQIPKGKVILRANPVSTLPENPSKSYYAFCGIARPEKFATSLQQSGLSVAGFKSFPDHYNYRDVDIETLKALAAESASRLITTSKDAARLAPRFIAGRDFDILGLGLNWPQVSKDMLVRTIKANMAS